MLTNRPPDATATLIRRRRRQPLEPRGHLIATGLTLRHGDHDVLVDASFEFRPGTTTHVIGRSTTDTNALLGLLLGLTAADEGTVLLDGRDLSDLPMTSTRTSVALVLQDPWIMGGTVADNIAYGDPGIDRERIETVARLACVDEIAERLPDGLDTDIGDGGVDLSPGQKRRVALARALLRRPDVLLIEDPMRSLSAREETQAIKAINRARAGRTTIITAQRLDASIYSTDQVLHLDDGQLVPADDDPGSPSDGDDPVAAERAPRARAADVRHEAPQRGPRAPRAIEIGHEIAPGIRAAGLMRRSERTETWLAWHAERSEPVEVRVPGRRSDRASAREALRAEFERANRLQHPGLSRPIEAELATEAPYAIYERVGGCLLSHLLGSGLDRPDPLEALAIGADLARTLAYLHRLGYAHLDLGPHVVKTGRSGVVITDLSRARRLGAATGTDAGLPSGLLAPELARGEPASTAMDLFALGALMFQIAAGHLIEASSGSTPALHPAALDRRVPGSVIAVIDALLAPSADQRPTAAEALGLMRPILLPVSPRPGGERQPTDGMVAGVAPGVAAGPATVSHVGAATDPPSG